MSRDISLKYLIHTHTHTKGRGIRSAHKSDLLVTSIASSSSSSLFIHRRRVAARAENLFQKAAARKVIYTYTHENIWPVREWHGSPEFLCIYKTKKKSPNHNFFFRINLRFFSSYYYFLCFILLMHRVFFLLTLLHSCF